jgi:RNA polymerase sigma-70 factor (ECF subfamily)
VDREERRLVKRLRRRDPDALREVYERYGRTTFGLLVRTLGDRAAAEDVQQVVFLEVWQRAERYDPGRGSLLTWILTIARSRAIDHVRRHVPEPRDPASAVALVESVDEARMDELVEQWHLAHLLGRLDPAESDVLRRRFYLGQSQSEIAEATGIPLGTVKSRMASGLGRLRHLVEAER